MKIIILLTAILLHVAVSVNAAILTGPSNSSFNFINAQIVIDPGHNLLIAHNQNINFVNTTISGGEGSSLAISTSLGIDIDGASKFLFGAGGSISLDASTINIASGAEFVIDQLVAGVNPEISVKPIVSENYIVGDIASVIEFDPVNAVISTGRLIMRTNVNTNLTTAGSLVISATDSNPVSLGTGIEFSSSSDIQIGSIITNEFDVSQFGISNNVLTANMSPVPIPPALWMFSSAIATLLVLLRRSKSKHKSAVAV